MSRWFRMYGDMLDDPKIGKLSDADFRTWVELLCHQCLSGDDDGNTGLTVEDLEWRLRRNVTVTLRETFHVTGLVTFTKDGKIMIPSWKRRQYRSDSSADRVRKHRESKRSQNCNGDVTLLKRKCNGLDTDTDTDTDTEKNTPLPQQGGVDSDTVGAKKEKSDPLDKFPILADAFPDLCAGILQRHGAAYLPTTDAETRKWRMTLAQCVTCEKLTEQEVADALRWCLFEEEGGHGGDFAWWRQIRSLGALRSKGKGSGVSKIKMVVKAWKEHMEHSETWRTQVNNGWTRPTTDGSKPTPQPSRGASSERKPNAIADAMENLPY